MTAKLSYLTIMLIKNNLSFSELCSLVDLPARTVRYYIQLGLVGRPEGAGRSAHYTETHAEELLAVKKWKSAGLSLERIGQLLSGVQGQLPPPVPIQPGEIEVWSRIHLADGVELHLNPGRSGLSAEKVREFAVNVELPLLNRTPCGC